MLVTKVKSINTNRYELSLQQVYNKYQIVYRHYDDTPEVSSELIADLNLALYLFEIKKIDLQGN